MQIMFLHVFGSAHQLISSGRCIIIFIIACDDWPVVLLRNRPAIRPRPVRLNTPDHVACELKSRVSATPQILYNQGTGTWHVRVAAAEVE